MPNLFLFLFGGCNGAGKTTTALRLLPALGCHNFVNADLVARGLAPLGGDVDFQAGVLMMRRLQLLRDAGEDFGAESTLAARAFVPFIRDCKQRGYSFHLFYLWLPTPELAIQRVAARVRADGHNIPPEVIRRRHEAGRLNFHDLYRGEADTWQAVDNSDATRLVAQGGNALEEEILDASTWEAISR